MTQHDAFLAAIREAPDDDAPRLMYADWLTEQGDPRGEFIRIQCELARMGSEDMRRPALARQANRLLRKHSRTWRAALPRLRGVHWGAFKRGFVAWATTSPASALLALEHILDAVPGTTLRFRSNGSRDLAKLFARPAAARITALEAEPFGWFSDPLAATAEIIAASPQATGLRSLTLFGDRLGVKGITALAGSPYLAGLRRLVLGGGSIGDAGASALAESPRLPSLRSLSLIDADIRGEGVQALARSDSLRLIELDLAENPIGSAGLRALADSPNMAGLQNLVLGECRSARDGVEALFTSLHLTCLVSLDLVVLESGTLRAGVLAGASPGTTLKQLQLSCGTINAAGARALANCPRLAGLRELGLDDNEFGDEGIVALAASPFLSDLRRLSLQDNRIGNKGAKALAAGGWRQLGTVDLRYNSISEAGVKALLAAPLGKHTSTLQLGSNPLGAEGRRLLRARRVRAWPTLQEGERHPAT